MVIKEKGDYSHYMNYVKLPHVSEKLQREMQLSNQVAIAERDKAHTKDIVRQHSDGSKISSRVNIFCALDESPLTRVKDVPTSFSEIHRQVWECKVCREKYWATVGP